MRNGRRSSAHTLRPCTGNEPLIFVVVRFNSKEGQHSACAPTIARMSNDRRAAMDSLANRRTHSSQVVPGRDFLMRRCIQQPPRVPESQAHPLWVTISQPSSSSIRRTSRTVSCFTSNWSHTSRVWWPPLECVIEVILLIRGSPPVRLSPAGGNPPSINPGVP